MKTQEKILIIDDSWIARMKIGETVKAAGYDVREAGSPEEGLAALEQDTPDLVLLDLLMPGIGGMGVLNELAGRKIFLPVIVVTADIQQTTRQGCLDAGAAAVINKPPDKDALLSEIRRLLSGRRAPV